MFNQSQKWSDTFLLGILGTSRQVGIYYIGLRIAGFISIPAAAMSTIFMPIAARLIGQKKNDELNDLYKTVTRVVFVCGTLGFWRGILFEGLSDWSFRKRIRSFGGGDHYHFGERNH
jgi:O-antigen/teichoic acid export membrane protein